MDGSGADILVSPDHVKRLETALDGLNATFQIVHNDMSLAVSQSDNVTESLVRLRGRPQIDLQRFNSHENES